jgi:polysaccharide chain length determinant protein (PEP-CTERM system associated)
MLGHRVLTMEDYAGILKRRFPIILICTIGLGALGAGVSYVIHPRYVSGTLVLIEQQQVPENYVKPVVTEDLGQRLASMKEQILSRTRLQPIIVRFNLYANHKYDMDKRVTLMQEHIGIRPIPSSRNGMPGFSIWFMAGDPRTAQQVCREITSLFVNDNLRQREQFAEGTTDFLKQQLANSKSNLDEQDAKLAAFQQKYFGMLPDQETSNSNTVQALTPQLNAVTENLSRLQQNETLLQAVISQETQGPAPYAAGSPDDPRKELRDLIKQKQALEALYTPDYPDVIEIKRKIAELQSVIAPTPAQPAPAASDAVNLSDSPQLQQLKAQLRAAQQSIADAKQQQTRIEQQIRTYEARIQSTPRVAEEYKQITRDHDSALQFYNSLLAKMNESSMATALEQGKQGEQFRVMDPPNLPDEPIFPDRFVFIGGGFAGGLALGLVLVSLLEYLDTSLRNERDVWAFTKLPTLATISHLPDLTQFERTSRRGKPFSGSTKPIASASS